MSEQFENPFDTPYDAPLEGSPAETAREALRRGDTEAALTAAREAVAAAPEDFAAHRVLAAAQRLNGDTTAALASIDRAIELAPDEPGLHLERGQLLFGARQLDAAEQALAQGIGLDPNQFPAYILQAQLALGRGDADEAERLIKLAARVAPQHPHVEAVQGMVALLRGQREDAISILSEAVARDPDDVQLLQSLAFAHLGDGNLAFAEQALRRVAEQMPDQASLRALIAQLMLRQGLPNETLAELQPLLDAEPVAPAVSRLAGESYLALNQPAQALPHLRASLAGQPANRRTLLVALEAWQRLGASEDARSVLDELLQQAPQVDDLWRARLSLEATGSAQAQDIVQRWLQARPQHLPALEAALAAHEHRGEREGVTAMAERIVALDPRHTNAQLRLVEALAENDPDAALERLLQMQRDAASPAERHAIRYPLALALDRAGDAQAAVTAWLEQHANNPVRFEPPAPSAPREDWPALASPAADNPAIGLLWGAPGSVVEDVAAVGTGMRLPIFSDRLSAQAPHDLLQRMDTAARLAAGELQPEKVADSWREALDDRRATGRSFIDWLPWWDNQLLAVLRPHLPEALLVIALRDPRDMLLDWLAFGAPTALSVQSPQAAASWLATVLEQVATLDEQNLFPHRLLRLDDALDEPQAMADAINQGMQTQLPPPPRAALGPQRLRSGRWRHYQTALSEAFALLAPVARRLGYAD